MTTEERKLIQQLRDALANAQLALAYAKTGAVKCVPVAIAAADAHLAKPDWIRVEDALPNNRKAKIVWCPSSKCQYMARFDDDVWLTWHDGFPFEPMMTEVSHWRELDAEPAPPEQPTTQENRK